LNAFHPEGKRGISPRIGLATIATVGFILLSFLCLMQEKEFAYFPNLSYLGVYFPRISHPNI
jgi:hypothetical protein